MNRHFSVLATGLFSIGKSFVSLSAKKMGICEKTEIASSKNAEIAFPDMTSEASLFT